MNQIKLTKNAIIFIAVAVFILLFLRECNSNSNLKQQLVNEKAVATMNYNNLLASQDTIKEYKTKDGITVSEKKSYVYDIQDFKSNQKSTAAEYKKALNLNDSLNKVNSLLKSEIETNQKIIANATVSKINDTTDVFTFKDSKDFGNGNTRKFDGTVKFSFNNNKFNIQNSEFNIDQTIKLYADIEDKNGYKSVRMSSSYPGIKFDSIENINLINNKLNEKSQKKARWSIGFGVGYGASLINGQVIQFAPTVGVGLYWSPRFLQF
jgi:hypothetical protein